MGAAWATLVARTVFLVPAWIILVNRFGLFRAGSWSSLSRDVAGRLWHVAWPTSVQLVVRISAMLVMHSIVARAYTTETDQSATTALGIVFRLETMALFVGLGWGSASQTFVGQCLGARLPARALASGWYATAYNACMMAALALLYRAVGPTLVAFFDPTPTVVAIGADYLLWVGPSYVGLGIGIVLGSAIQGAGASRQTLAIDGAMVLCLQVPASLLVVFGWHAGASHLWQVLAATYVAYALVYAAWYRRGVHLHTSLVA
jgi:Na+-driven multidrug efflux pump